MLARLQTSAGGTCNARCTRTHTHQPRRRDASGNSKDSLAAPWFYVESPGFYSWLRETYM